MWNVVWIESGETVVVASSKEAAEAHYIAFNLTEPKVYMHFREREQYDFSSLFHSSHPHSYPGREEHGQPL